MGPQAPAMHTFWMHLGLAYLNPFRMTFVELKQVQMDEGQMSERVFLQTTHHYLTEFKVAAMLDLKLHWSVATIPLNLNK